MKTNLENYEERFVDYMEGQLDAAEMKDVEAFVALHPELENDFKLFCSTKLEPDTSVVFTQKESLKQPVAVIRPMYVRIVTAAACIALLIGVGIHFLRPNQASLQQPLLSSLTPIAAQPLETTQTDLKLSENKIKTKVVSTQVPKQTTHEQSTFEPSTMELIANLNPIASMPLQWNGLPIHDDMESQMTIALDERLAALEPFENYGQTDEYTLGRQREEAIASLNGYLLGNALQFTKNAYKQTAKTVMSAYQTTGDYFDEAKERLLASR